jgi:hypothetical protein
LSTIQTSSESSLSNRSRTRGYGIPAIGRTSMLIELPSTSTRLIIDPEG